ncbi:MAG: NAD-dependent succinate-semialdehyde dehydrogenase [Acidimicrobiia bacterium]
MTTIETSSALDLLEDRELLRELAFVNGEWVGADDGGTFEVRDPASGRVLAEVPVLGATETTRALDAAGAAFETWGTTLAKERAAILRRWADLMRDNSEDLSLILTAEQGKPLSESRGEVEYAASFLEWFGEEAKRVYGDVIPTPMEGRRIVVFKEPLGVTGGITPWNFPSAMVTRKCAPAVAAGNTMVLKPAEQTPLSALAVCVLAERAGLPPGVLNVVTTPAEKAQEVGETMTSDPRLRMLGFTGSTEVGKLLMKQCADTVTKVSLELGGNAPFIVFEDADLELALGAMQSCKYRNSGQTCISANRILVQESVHDEFVAMLTDYAAGLVVGSGIEEGSQIGPLIDQQGLDKVERHIANALESGAEIVVGGSPHDRGGLFFQPTVLTGVSPEMDMSCEETFGPVAGIIPFRTEEEAIAIANDTPYGLCAYFFTKDLARAWRVGEALEAGIVGLNTGFVSTEVAPFGGVKQSGIGREGSKYGIEEWVDTKYFTFAGL